MNKKMIICISCTVVGLAIISIASFAIINNSHKKETLALTQKLNAEYDKKLQDAKEELKKELAEEAKKEEEKKQKEEESKKEQPKEVEKKESNVEKNNSTPKETPKNNAPQESPDLLKRSRLSNLDKNFWATTISYINRNVYDAQGCLQYILETPNISENEVRQSLNSTIESLNANANMISKAQNQGIPSVCRSDFENFKNLFNSYKNNFNSILDKNSRSFINASKYQKCQQLLNGMDSAFSKMESKLK